MKTVITALALLLLAGNAFAEEESDDTYCAAIHDLATTIMDGRQLGVSITESLNLSNCSTNICKIGRSLVLAAYKEPQYSSDKYQQEAISEFANQVALQCYLEQE